ncbi:hypothetical protein F6R98_20050 [Candidatus Methylospira mobilis]|uniref:Uncharacterized protein n=1 Tax=Candidatus Methylospira mobilis TaxID=1808979 RepID=A0A5Q0BSH9_9GAMM|nr:hypothetical protein [Candidatus Methylospira mobilis]QFY44636.1 hypothetical protein F6R98_20050 [Candidatus Methylospira mobilis]
MSRDTFDKLTSKDGIAFAYGEPLRFNQSTGIGSLLDIGALLNTRRYDPATGKAYTATDREGLERLEYCGAEAVSSILMSLSAVGKAVGWASDNLDSADVSTIGWLITGLSDVALRVDEGLGDVRHEIQRDFGGEVES